MIAYSFTWLGLGFVLLLLWFYYRFACAFPCTGCWFGVITGLCFVIFVVACIDGFEFWVVGFFCCACLLSLLVVGGFCLFISGALLLACLLSGCCLLGCLVVSCLFACAFARVGLVFVLDFKNLIALNLVWVGFGDWAFGVVLCFIAFFLC